MKAELNWVGGLEFVAKGESGHEVVVDAAEKDGGNDNGSRPMELLLHGLSGCTAIDIALILKKMKADLIEFRVEVNADRKKEHPKRYTRIHLKFFLRGKGLTDKKVEKAIRLSQEKYCSATSSLNAEISSSYEFVNED
jgi:putative redox protein